MRAVDIAPQPRCRLCDKPATCFGYEGGSDEGAYSCDDHCWHGDEDGRCHPVSAAANGRAQG